MKHKREVDRQNPRSAKQNEWYRFCWIEAVPVNSMTGEKRPMLKVGLAADLGTPIRRKEPWAKEKSFSSQISQVNLLDLDKTRSTFALGLRTAYPSHARLYIFPACALLEHNGISRPTNSQPVIEGVEL